MDKRECEARAELRTKWAGCILLEELQLAEMRAILWAHLEPGETTQKALARELGLSPHRLRAFLSGGGISDEAWEAVARWTEGKPHPDVAAETVAIGALARWASDKYARGMRERIARTVREAYAEQGRRLPPWAAEALDMA